MIHYSSVQTIKSTGLSVNFKNLNTKVIEISKDRIWQAYYMLRYDR